MKESYVEYIISQCSDLVVASVCKRFKTKDELLNTTCANSEYFFYFLW